jgi:hypothetical protein
VHHALGQRRVGGELAGVEPEPDEPARRLREVGDPRRHEVEHLAVESELVIERPDGGDGPVVDVRDEPGPGVELGVGAGVRAVEEAGREDGVGHDHRR